MQNLKSQLKIKNYVALVFLLSASLALPLIGQAAELYLESFENSYYINDTFIIEVRMNVQDNENINAIECYLKFPKDILEAKNFSTGNSILTFIEEPKINQEQGLISFTGIIPGGYSGRIPGDPGQSNLLGKIIFYSVFPGRAEIIFQDISQVLSSDGKGTSVNLINKGLTVDIKLLDNINFIQNEWQDELEKDKIPPEDFNPEIIQIDNKYYLAFSAKDKDSGIDHYKILEKNFWADINKIIGIAKWINVESPYLLKDQKLDNMIEIKAIDKAGNEKIIKLPATYFLPWYKRYYFWCIILLVFLCYVIRKLWIYLKIK